MYPKAALNEGAYVPRSTSFGQGAEVQAEQTPQEAHQLLFRGHVILGGGVRSVGSAPPGSSRVPKGCAPPGSSGVPKGVTDQGTQTPEMKLVERSTLSPCNGVSFGYT